METKGERAGVKPLRFANAPRSTGSTKNEKTAADSPRRKNRKIPFFNRRQDYFTPLKRKSQDIIKYLFSL